MYAVAGRFPQCTVQRRSAYCKRSTSTVASCAVSQTAATGISQTVRDSNSYYRYLTINQPVNADLHNAVSHEQMKGNSVACIIQATVCGIRLVMRWLTICGWTVSYLSRPTQLAIPVFIGGTALTISTGPATTKSG